MLQMTFKTENKSQSLHLGHFRRIYFVLYKIASFITFMFKLKNIVNLYLKRLRKWNTQNDHNETEQEKL